MKLVNRIQFKIMNKKALILLIFASITLSMCVKDKVQEVQTNCVDALERVTYNDQIETIINNRCSYSGCHDNAGSQSPAMTNYASMISSLNNGDFERRVITQMDMPDPNVVSESQLLTQEENDLIACWIEGGFLEQ